VRKLASAGHEIASHGYEHKRVTDQTYGSFLADIRLAKAILEDVSQMPVSGYRAPSFSVGPGNAWAFDCMLEAGYRYSSSVYPIRHDHYGMPDAPRFAHRVNESLLEVPITTLRLFERNLPSSGGGYFRLLPYALSRWMMQRVNNDDRQSVVFYFHPWEIDVHQPRVAGIDRKTRFRHYVNVGRMEERLECLLSDFRWGRMDRIFLRPPAYAVPN
jgi:polysaccharide deacetylase family protein (PEP-CTERM system associated)